MKKGFAHIELLVVLTVLVILAGGVWVWQKASVNPIPSMPGTTLCSSLEIDGYELADRSFNGGVNQNAEYSADLRGEGHKDLVRVYAEKVTLTDEGSPRSKSIIIKVFSDSDNCYKEELSFDGTSEKRSGNEVGKIEVLKNFWNDSKDVLAVETISTGYGSGFTLFLNLVAFKEGKYQIVPGPTMGELSSYKYTGAQGKGSEILVASGVWDSDENHFDPHAYQFVSYKWDDQKYNQKSLSVTKEKYAGPDIDTIIAKEPSVLKEPTMDWGAYDNREYQYSIKYPNDFTVKNTTASLKQLYQRDRVPRNLLLRESLVRDEIVIDISVYENKRTSNIIGWLEDGSWSVARSADAYSNQQLPEISINGRTALYGYQIGLGGTTKTVVLPGSGVSSQSIKFMYVIELDPRSGCYGDNEIDIRDKKICNLFDQILSTFRFD